MSDYATQWIWDDKAGQHRIWSQQKGRWMYRNEYDAIVSSSVQNTRISTASGQNASGSHDPRTQPRSTQGASAYTVNFSPTAQPYSPSARSAPLTISQGASQQYRATQANDAEATPRNRVAFPPSLDDRLASLSLNRPEVAPSGSYGQAAFVPTTDSNSRVTADPDSGVVQYVVVDPSGVQSTYQTGPAKQLTDPELYRVGIGASKKFSGSPGAAETLDENYRVRGHPRRFFQIGRVFQMLHAEPAGQSAANARVNDVASAITLDTRFNEPFHIKVRRFVVVRAADTFCSAIAIWTYEGRGVAKRGVRKSDHAIIYTGRAVPAPQDNERPSRGETGMRQPIRVDQNDRQDPLNPMSRVNFAKVYTVEHNVKVLDYGFVNKESMANLKSQFLEVWMGQVQQGQARTQADPPERPQPHPRHRADSLQPQRGTSGYSRSNPQNNVADDESDDHGSDQDGSESSGDEGHDQIRTGTVELRLRQLVEHYMRQGFTQAQSKEAVRASVDGARRQGYAQDRAVEMVHTTVFGPRRE